MPVKVGINGFGRIGRLVTRAGIKDPGLEFVAVNDITDAKTLAHLFKYDSALGPYHGEVKTVDDGITIDGKTIKIFSERDPANIPWKDVGAEAIVESTGLFRSREAVEKHIQGGAKRVLISAPAKGHDGTFVKGVNLEQFDKSKHKIISIGSCTTNCLAPIVKVINDSFKIKQAFMTTIHAYTNDQRILDAPHKDLRRARSAALSMIPTTTGAAKAISEVIPDVKGKIDGCAIRVPTPVGSLIDLVADLEKSVSIDDVNAAMKKAADGSMKGVLQYTEDPIVSVDIIANPHSSIFDSLATMKVGDRFIKVFSWYDNEWGFSNRVIDMLKMMGD